MTLTFELVTGKAQLATELVLSPEEFDKYHIASVPASVAFQLREFTVNPLPPFAWIVGFSTWTAGDRHICRFDGTSHPDALHRTRPPHCHCS